MKKIFLIVSFFICFKGISQKQSAFELGVKLLDEGQTIRAYQLFKKELKLNGESAETYAYLSYSTSRICYNQDTIKLKDISIAKENAINAMNLDSSFYISRLAYAFSLLLETEYKEGDKQKNTCDNLAKVKRHLDFCIEISNYPSLYEAYNLLGIWHRKSSKFNTQNDIKGIKTPNQCDLNYGQIEKAVESHKSCLELKKTIRFYFELGLTYEQKGDSYFAKEAFSNGAKLKAKTEEEKRYKLLVTEKIGY